MFLFLNSSDYLQDLIRIDLLLENIIHRISMYDEEVKEGKTKIETSVRYLETKRLKV